MQAETGIGEGRGVPVANLTRLVRADTGAIWLRH